jgi:CRISPR system Cascade subunit CasC
MPLNHHFVSRRKNMNIELHLIQNFAPSNLNRSDTGTPKECEFGGVRRARVSSQCFKRAIRDHFDQGAVFNDEQKGMLAKRTRLLLDKLTEAITAQGKDRELARRVALIALNAGGLEIKEDGKTEFLVFLGQGEIQKMAKLCAGDYWSQLVETDQAYEAGRRLQEDLKAKESAAKSGSKEEKDKAKEEIKQLKEKLKTADEAAKKAIPKEIEKAVKEVLDGGKAADLALFGRMLATLPEKNRDAACQVAHAISTHKVGVEFDFYTAVDDLLPTGETGAGMMGTVEFNSACFYRYANIDVKQLTENLGNDTDLAHATIEAFLRSMIHAIPTGKQNSMAAQNLPSFVLAVVRPHGFWSLANAFVNPIKGANIVNDSIKELDKYWGQLATVYGGEGLSKAYVNLSGEDLPNLNGARQASINDLVTATLAAVRKGA